MREQKQKSTVSDTGDIPGGGKKVVLPEAH